jgi:hypothetical protein
MGWPARSNERDERVPIHEDDSRGISNTSYARLKALCTSPGRTNGGRAHTASNTVHSDWLTLPASVCCMQSSTEHDARCTAVSNALQITVLQANSCRYCCSTVCRKTSSCRPDVVSILSNKHSNRFSHAKVIARHTSPCESQPSQVNPPTRRHPAYQTRQPSP